MEENKEFELELSEETMQMLEEYAKKNNQTPEEVVEYIIYEFLRNQLHVIERRAEETNTPVNTLVNMQFARIVSYLNQKKA
ncbi:hypothetical protein Desca_0936 [Desulfotomaculum nigrificans CO-1-SRB]|uniref:Uncharacterized protein n=1 Tax=Desulfotomaculum nigrificans (strain DSM 14880 / VKM B-2319 / CO-1-SRB) TaxID=868595 RepID=F6B9W4_DESCC|nr:hypothetical protein [Desulfotomaculum nigrificans]AEF93812.1 hypothetical protein Desca_0936 [Desulfotomaculum nigrificans CO-1-SRB]